MAYFYLDNDVATRVADELRTLGHHAVTTRSLHRGHTRDEQQLLFAAQQGWIVVTHNAKDFILLHDAWQLWANAWQVPAQHAGIMIPPHGSTWPATKIALELHRLLQIGQMITNQLFEWYQTTWVQR